MIYYVYTHTRKDTDEIFYVGIGRTSKKGRYSRAYSKNRKNKDWLRVLKDCFYNYEVQILFEYDNIEDCCKKEIELIQKYGRKIINDGLLVNIAPGGHKWKDPVKVYQYDLDGNFLAEWESVQIASAVLNLATVTIYESCRFLYRGGKYQFRKNKVSKLEPWKHKQSKKVYCFNMLGEYVSEFDSIGSAAKHFNTYHNEITAVLERKRYSVKNHIFSYNRNKCFVKRLIFQYDQYNNIIAKYSSLPDIVQKLNLKSHNSIDNALKGIQQQAYGYIWKEINNLEIYVD